MLTNSASGGDAPSRGFDTPTWDLESAALLHAISEHGGYAYVSMAVLAASSGSWAEVGKTQKTKEGCSVLAAWSNFIHSRWLAFWNNGVVRKQKLRLSKHLKPYSLSILNRSQSIAA
ncbi:hypothetical protein JHK87_010438 [Glycine soja]|nr:hypothetical protein JHK87_010438 [Glycine soja]